VRPAIPPPATSATIHELRASPDGGAYATFTLSGCEPGPCPEAQKLFRLGPDGTPDHAFNGPNGGVAVSVAAMMVDSENRPVVALSSGAKIRLVRFRRNGKPDPSFGAGGRVTLDCHCQEGIPAYLLRLRLRAGGGGKIVLTGFTKEQWKRPSRLWITRLLPDGTVDRGFGDRGATTMVVHKRDLVSLAVSPRGPIYLASADCCGGVVRLQKVSAKGVVDAGFDTRAARMLAGIHPTPSAATLMPRDDGRLDVFLRGGRGLTVRLRPNGEAATGFGRRGLLPGPSVESVARAGGGRTFAVVWRGGARLVRLRADGRVDPGFGGSRGFPIPDTHGPVYVEAVNGNGAMVVDTGRVTCRSGCFSHTPKFIRYLGS
ncbi:MAG: hypothetical protein QOE75_1743, partial [Solirubrobacterales bacterium]|nr:hypothetical protein [Solirubrobacterales bacterium]